MTALVFTRWLALVPAAFEAQAGRLYVWRSLALCSCSRSNLPPPGPAHDAGRLRCNDRRGRRRAARAPRTARAAPGSGSRVRAVPDWASGSGFHRRRHAGISCFSTWQCPRWMVSRSRDASGARSADQPIPRVGDLEIGSVHRRVWRSRRDVHLTPSESAVLRVLATHADRVLTRKDVLRAWLGPACADENEHLRTHINASGGSSSSMPAVRE
jgi:hypothetical protein